MIEPPSITDTDRQAAAVIHVTIPRDRMQTEMPAAINELMAAVSGQGLRAAGPLFAHHLTTSSEFFDFEVGVPVNAVFSGTGRVKPGELPAAKVARTVYHGGYEGLFLAWEEFGKRIQAELGTLMEQEGLEPGETLWERYLSGPESDLDPATWKTELNRPLRRVTS